MAFIERVLPTSWIHTQFWAFSEGVRDGLDVVARAVLVTPVAGKRRQQRMLLLRGSRIRPEEHASCPRSASNLRRALIERELLSLQRDGTWYDVTRHLVFSSPSLLANVVAGCSKNGWKWTNEPLRLTLGEAFDAAEAGQLELNIYRPPLDAVELG